MKKLALNHKELIAQDNFQRRGPDYTKAWKEYRQKYKKKSKRTKVTTEEEYRRIVKSCLKYISHAWTNSTGGIYVKNFGYLALLRSVKKIQSETNPIYISNILRCHGYIYLLTHITTLKPSDSFGGFKIRSAYRSVKSQVTKNVIKGRRYTLNNAIIKEYIKRRTYL